MVDVAKEMTTAEWEVMRVIWTMGDMHSGEIIKLMQAKRDWTESTIKTLLRRLVEKQALTTQKDGRKFVYHAAVAEQTAMAESGTDLFTHFCNMKKGQVLLHLVQETELSAGDITKLQAALAQKAVNAPETVACNCLPAGGCAANQEEKSC
jgi:CopY/TcrY family copper transport repressor